MEFYLLTINDDYHQLEEGASHFSEGNIQFHKLSAVQTILTTLYCVEILFNHSCFWGQIGARQHF